MDKVVLRVFQREVEHQCRFVLIAAEDMRQALRDRERLDDELDRRFAERRRQEMSALERSGRAARGPVLMQMSMQNELGDWWEHLYDVRARFWYSVQSLLVAAANISKLLWPSYRGKKENLVPGRGEELRKGLTIGEEHTVLKPRTLRNHFEHYDVRLEEWAASSDQPGLSDLTMRSSGSVGRSSGSIVGGSISPDDEMRAFDADGNTVTFRGEAYRLQPIIDAVQDIWDKAKVEIQNP